MTNEQIDMKAAFQDSIARLKLAHQAWLSEGVVGGDKRERAIAIGESLLLLGKVFGIDFDSYLYINSLGEINLKVEPESEADRRASFTGKYGKNFALLLSQYEIRTGTIVTKGYVLPENGWCRINHFEAEKMGYPDLAVFEGSQPPGFQ